MRFSLSWLKSHLETDEPTNIIIDALISLGIEVEEVQDQSKQYKNFKLGKIASFEKHPNADRLNYCQVDIGEQNLVPIICGAPNIRQGMLVAFAPPGVVIPSTGDVLKVGKIRGIESQGMLCSAKELLLGDDHDGIMDIKTDVKVGSELSDVLGLNEVFIDVSITPNRADCFSVRGLARDLAAKGIGQLKPIKTNLSDKSANDITLCKIETPYCTQFLATKIDNVKTIESPDFIKKRLESAGISPMNLLVDITNYIALDLGQPMHVYDADKVKGALVAKTKESGKLQCLDGSEITIQNTDVVICDDSDILGLAGIMGGISSSVTDSTKNIIFETATFDPIAIAKSGQFHMIISNARQRFERGVDPHIAKTAIGMASELVLEYVDGSKVSAVDFKTQEVTKKIVQFNPSLMEKRTGVKLSEDRMKEVLANLGCHLDQTQNVWNIKVPTWRFDIEIPEDITEELLRVMGYAHLVPDSLPPRHASLDEEINLDLSHKGFMECVTLPFCNKEKAGLFCKDLIELENPISKEMSIMRPSLFCGLFETLVHNLNYGQDRCAFTESGNIYKKVIDKPFEEYVVAGLRCGSVIDKSWFASEEKTDLFDSKADCVSVFYDLGYDEKSFQLTRDVPDYFHPHRAGCYRQGKKIVAYFGEIHPLVLKKYGIKKTTIGFEIFLQKLPKKVFKSKEFQASIYPKKKLDLSFIVDKKLECSDIQRVIQSENRDLIQNISVFDIYEGQGIPDGKKALAFQFDIQPTDKTLTDEDIKTLMNGIVKKVESKFNAKLRDGQL